MNKEQNPTEVMNEVVEDILDLADKQRKSSEPYKDLFERTSGKPIPIQLREVHNDLIDVVLNYAKILQGEGYKVSNDIYDMLLALPILADRLEGDICKKDGLSCCVDKTYYILEKEFTKKLQKE